MSGTGRSAFIAAVKPLVDAMGGEMIPPDEAGPDDVVLTWEDAAAVAVRHGVETVASALGVSRFTVYNYLNREKGA